MKLKIFSGKDYLALESEFGIWANSITRKDKIIDIRLGKEYEDKVLLYVLWEKEE